jgi:hypothetical protein
LTLNYKYAVKDDLFGLHKIPVYFSHAAWVELNEVKGLLLQHLSESGTIQLVCLLHPNDCSLQTSWSKPCIHHLSLLGLQPISSFMIDILLSTLFSNMLHLWGLTVK